MAKKAHEEEAKEEKEEVDQSVETSEQSEQLPQKEFYKETGRQTNVLKGNPCPFCGKKELTLTESEMDVPFFGKTYVFSMNCSACKVNQSDVEFAELKEPSSYTIEVSGDKDMSIRIVKSSNATVKIPNITTITPGPIAEGYITNTEGLLQRVRTVLENEKNAAEEDDKDKLTKLIKKINRTIWGSEKLKITIEDPTGNSAIISDKAVKKKLGK